MDSDTTLDTTMSTDAGTQTEAGFDDAALAAIFEDGYGSADEPDAADPQQEDTGADQTEEPAPAQQEQDQTQNQSRQQEDGKPADPQAEPKPPELYTLKNRDETRQVTLEQMQAMAQKGWDYDSVRAERDELRDFRAEAQDALDLVDQYAQLNGQSRADYIDWARQRQYVQQGLDEANARAMVERDKWQAEQQAQTRAQEAAQAALRVQQQMQMQQQEARRRDMEVFIRTFPGVKGSDITPEVWADANQCGSLTAAYTRAQNRQLKAQIAAMQQNQTNRQKAAGSMAGAAADTMDDEIAAIFEVDY